MVCVGSSARYRAQRVVLVSNIASLVEVHAAQAFLRHVGADWKNQDLIRGVVAWFRQASKDTYGGRAQVRGNNIFGLRNSAGKLYTYATFDAAAIAAADRLLAGSKIKGDPKAYGLVIRAAKSGRISDFLQAIAMSAWDAAHYGYTPDHPENNHLFAVFNAITGLTMPAPPPAPAPPRRRFPQQPRDIPHPFAPSPYLDAGQVGRAYRERHKNPMGNVASDGPRGL